MSPFFYLPLKVACKVRRKAQKKCHIHIRARQTTQRTKLQRRILRQNRPIDLEYGPKIPVKLSSPLGPFRFYFPMREEKVHLPQIVSNSSRG